MYDMLELDALPRQGNVLTARIHQHRYERRRARRRQIAGTIALVVLALASFFWWPQLQPLLIQLDGYQWVALGAGGVFVGSSLRLIRKRRRARRNQQHDGS